jgi:hypothetical protein
MDLLVIDDASQRKPTRDGMGPLVAVGGFHLPGESARSLEVGLEELCLKSGFPQGEEFKWSPGSRSWMRKALQFDRRRDFFLAALDLARKASATAIVAVSDTQSQPASSGVENPEHDVVTLFLERAQNLLGPLGTDAIVLFDRPSGNRKAERKFLARCLQTIRAGTPFVDFEHLAFAVSTDSHLVRVLQLADVVVSCTLSCVAGEKTWAPPVFQGIRPMLRTEGRRVGGVGLKLHPDRKYVNLYHWLVGDTYYRRGMSGWDLPIPGRPYASSPNTR